MFNVVEQPVPTVDLDEVFRVVNEILENTQINILVNTREMSRLVIDITKIIIIILNLHFK